MMNKEERVAHLPGGGQRHPALYGCQHPFRLPLRHSGFPPVIPPSRPSFHQPHPSFHQPTRHSTIPTRHSTSPPVIPPPTRHSTSPPVIPPAHPSFHHPHPSFHQPTRHSTIPTRHSTTHPSFHHPPVIPPPTRHSGESRNLRNPDSQG